jgi:hypothetical protein
MSKVIEIEQCEDCPHLSHTGAFTPGGGKPCCNHPETVKTKGSDCFKRVIPYKNSISEIANLPFRTPKRIPDWCPLESGEDYAERTFDIDRKF